VEKRPDPLIAILISGRGSNLRALVEARLPAPIRVVLSNVAGAGGLDYARAQGIETLVMPHGEYSSRDAFDRALSAALVRRGISLVCLAGFMRRLGPAFCDAFPNAILNVHPSLLPAFPGVDAQGQALRHGVKISGATVHFVTPELDAGPIILQTPVTVHDEDTAEALAARILTEEHRIYPAAVRLVLAGGWRLDGRRAILPGP
jgi:phosphoribosylglycinamide formyltransferase-1